MHHGLGHVNWGLIMCTGGVGCDWMCFVLEMTTLHELTHLFRSRFPSLTFVSCNMSVRDVYSNIYSTFHSMREYLAPVLKHSKFKETGCLTPEEVGVSQ